jgi:ubiquinone/menaquinone biosynthesis C-methylase UbiE
MESTQPSADISTLKDRLKTVWTAGDFAVIARTYEKGAAEFVGRLGIRPGTRLLDVACGDGNTTLPAAHAGASVTGLDLAPYLIERAKERAKEQNIDATFDIGDVEAMPYPDASFDMVITMFGAMFAPRPEVTAGELVRVCRPGGLIAMANWTPEGFIGQMFKLMGKHVKPPAGMPSPLLWGDEDTVGQRFSQGVADLKMLRQIITFEMPFSPADVVEMFRKFYGPTQKAFDSLDAEAQTALRKDLEHLWTENNSAEDNTTRVLSEYLEVHATRA